MSLSITSELFDNSDIFDGGFVVDNFEAMKLVMQNGFVRNTAPQPRKRPLARLPAPELGTEVFRRPKIAASCQKVA
jgi:hypothetical protein